MHRKVSVNAVEKWLKGWALSRGLPLPVAYRTGFRVDVGHEKQQARYVFPHVNNDLTELAMQLNQPWVYIKACASLAALSSLPSRWVIQPQGYMMNCPGKMKHVKSHLPAGYSLSITQYNSTYLLTISTQNGEEAASGRVVLVNYLAVYDRILTAENHRRKGLAAFIMKELEHIALSQRITDNMLVATEQGRLLYEALGWQLYSLYTSVVIPGAEEGI